jgi:DNA-binding CsgD family transcriptional regulator
MAGSPHFGNQERAHAFAAFLERHRGEDHIVALQDYPDPDAIAASLAYRMLAARFEIGVDIIYEGRISHQENLALVQVLDIALTRYTDAVPIAGFDGAIFIDNQGTTTRLTDRLAEARVPALAIIDHHAPQSVLEAEFTDIRPVGAAATLVVDYLRSGAVMQLDPERREHVQLATALVHAVRSETGDFVRAGPEEFSTRTLVAPTRAGPVRVESSSGGLDGSIVVVFSPERRPEPPSIPLDWPLTRQERRVVEMVVRGLTNSEVAARLFVSEKTVETHLGNVYEKLSVRGRSQLIARFFQTVYLPDLSDAHDFDTESSVDQPTSTIIVS